MVTKTNVPMSYLLQQLKKLDEIARNPNSNGGIFKSFSMFISISDELLKRKEVFIAKASEDGKCGESIFGELESIRNKFVETFGFELESGINFGSKFESAKNSPARGPKFRKNLSKLMESYKGKFL